MAVISAYGNSYPLLQTRFSLILLLKGRLRVTPPQRLISRLCTKPITQWIQLWKLRCQEYLKESVDWENLIAEVWGGTGARLEE